MSLTKSTLLGGFLLFILLQVFLGYFLKRNEERSPFPTAKQEADKEKITAKETKTYTSKEIKAVQRKISGQRRATVEEKIRKTEVLVNLKESYTVSMKNSIPEIPEIIRNVERYNKEQFIHNKQRFGPLKNDSVVIVVQTHTRISYLHHLIYSLSQAQGISNALLIFSHDHYDEEINNLVQSVDFCMVLQIFYPHSIQTHPNEFPGMDPRDCPRDIKQEMAVAQRCTNALDPDGHGHYREAKYTQTKHHWWWKANRVFNQLEATKHHNGLVLFLEEDHYVVEDFLHVLKLMDRDREKLCGSCDILSLASYEGIGNFPSRSAQVDVSMWISSKHNMGMAFNRSTWNQIVECASDFCKYDDYNWDWSLLHVSWSCCKQQLEAIVVRSDRVYHVGECGMHHMKENCQLTSVIKKIQIMLTSERRFLYPDNLILSRRVSKKSFTLKSNGGWSDRRDHNLCMNMTIGL